MGVRSDLRRVARGWRWGHPSFGKVDRQAEDFDTSWARRYPAKVARDAILDLALGPIIAAYCHPRVVGAGNLAGLRHPVVFAANHTSHLDTPVTLRALPRAWRDRTAVVAAADYFYKRRSMGALVSLTFNTVPIERRRLSETSARRIERLIHDHWSVLVFPEGTRSEDGWVGIVRGGAGFLSVANGIPLVPIYVSGTFEAMPRGRSWPRHHPVTVYIGTPLHPQPGEDHRGMTRRFRAALDRLADESRTDWWQAALRAGRGESPPSTGPHAAQWRRSWERTRPRAGFRGIRTSR
ncbi:MAG TPA: lysophospholipid acyltransferase family protein [Actinomycetota bacterium]|nr:lysophospholipid acyltransferase family protein [Candidatus Acidoferrum sp.]HYU56926.1 lysophospholipid acyltransferase family protein [Actinomycetota bacterium]